MKPRLRPARHAGFALVATLMLLIILTIMGLAMLRNIGLEGRMAGNFREKGRAFEAAQSALQYGEWWLLQGANAATVSNASSTGTACASLASSPRVCSNALATPSTLSNWSALGSTYSPPGLSVASSGSNTFAQAPQLYIQDLGLNGNLNGELYQITTLGYGGNTNSVVVLQSTYTLYSGVKNLGTGS